MDNNPDYEHPSMQGGFVQGGEQPPVTQPPIAQQPVMQQVPPTQALPTSGLAIAGMVLGIIALLTVFIPIINFGSPVLAIIGLALSIVGFVGIKNGKKSGKGIAIAGIALCAIVTVMALLVSAACSAAVSSSAAKASSSSEAVAASSSASPASGQAAASASEESKYVGTWDVVEVTVQGKKYNEQAVEASRKKGDDSFLVLEEDGSAIYVLAGARGDFSWEVVDDNTINVYRGKEVSTKLKLKDDVLGGDTLKLRRGEPRASIPAPANGQASSGTGATSAAVDPDLKAFLDSYEAFADEYVAFMQKYKESGDAVGMMQDYTEFMQRYNDFASKANSYQSKNMSDADRAYYIEVTGRVSKKLLEAAV